MTRFIILLLYLPLFAFSGPGDTIFVQTFTFDSILYATYRSGLAGLPNGQGAKLDLYLFDDSGAPMQGLSRTPICDPCSYGLGTGPAGTANPRWWACSTSS